MNASPHEIAITMMTEEEARHRVRIINSGINNLRAQILDFHDREGWKALGYDNWVDCVQKEFSIGQSYVYRLFEAAKIEARINENSPMGEKEEIPERQLRPLASVPSQEQATVYQLAKETAPEGKLTAKHVEKVVKEITENPRKVFPANKQAPANVVDVIINYIDLIKDTDPGCKEALKRIAVHVWNRQHEIKEPGEVLSVYP